MDGSADLGGLAQLDRDNDASVLCVVRGARYLSEAGCLEDYAAFGEKFVDADECETTPTIHCVRFVETGNIYVFQGEHYGLPDGDTSMPCEPTLHQQAIVALPCTDESGE